ncbi:hypothetical protein [Bradyrhizobium genosp. P]|uniref:hypothetical protein n=1 Tax=Bradyrhizobium genosp. P TaxID=83641 RepID=UPI003CF7DCA9
MTIRLLAIIPILSLGGCYGLYGNDEMDRYFQRSDTITMSAGDAKQVNAVTHTINPWPRYVGDTRIATDARRTSAAVTRYSTTARPVDQLPDIGKAGEAIGQAPPVTRNYNYNVSGAGSGSPSVSAPIGGGGGNQ